MAVAVLMVAQVVSVQAPLSDAAPAKPLGKAAVAAAAADIIPDDGGSAAPAPVTQNMGDYQTSVAFEVPAFHGIEPRLGFSYSSSGSDGLAGVGWQAAGFPQVDRTSPVRGAPRYDATDVYTLNGEELVANTSLGGQYVTKRQSFRRIGFDAATSVWTLVDPGGVKYTLGKAVKIGTLTPRWLVSSVTDPHGNTVSYSYWCDPTGFQCYPNVVSYNGATVTFYRETRPDVSKTAVGGLLTTSYRIKSVKVAVGAAIARVYKLGYVLSGATDRSLLDTVTQYGTNATVDATGTVTGGSALPAIKMGYQADTTAAGGSPGLGGFCPIDPSQAPEENRNKLLSGDVNGDGKIDLVCAMKPVWGPGQYTISVALATGTGYGGSSVWLSGWCSAPGGVGTVMLADVNGDGKADIVCQTKDQYDNGMTYVELSNGSNAFTGGGLWRGWWCYQGTLTMADVNGDGEADAVCKTVSEIYVGLSNGSNAFTGGGVWIGYGWCQYSKLMMADVNGDGKADAVCKAASDIYVGLSNGSNAFTGGGLWKGYWCWDATSTLMLADVNGDGKADAVCWDGSNYSTNIYVELSDGFSAFTGGGLWKGNNWCWGGKLRMADVNGDGKADAVCDQENSYTYQHSVSVARSNGSSGFVGDASWVAAWCYVGMIYLVDGNADGRSDLGCADSAGTAWLLRSGSQVMKNDLLTSLTSQTGGVTSIGYSMVGGAGGRPRAVVTRVTQNPSVGPSVVTDYASTGPLWDPLERRFLGFASVTASNSTGSSATTVFRQVAGYPVSRPSTITVANAAGVVLSKVTTQYQESTAGGVYTSLPNKTIRAVCSGASLCQSNSATYTYNGYGNVTQVLENGDDAKTGDERLTVIGFVPNTTAYLVNYPISQAVYAGTTTSGTLLSRTANAYDNQCYWTCAPLKGDITKVTAWLDTTNTWQPAVQASYDAVGNVVSVTNELAAISTVTYDATRSFPVQSCNALGHCAGTGWNTVLGLPTSHVDEANTGTPTTTMAYDVFGRPTVQTLPDGATTTTSYLNVGNPGTQYVQTSVSDGTANGLWTRTYLDGLGRAYKSTAESGATVLTTYNAQGQTASSSLPHFPPAAPQYTTMGYDALGRTTVVIAPDGAATTTTTYAVVVNAADPDFATARMVQTTCDPGDYCVRQAMDGYGQPAVIDERTGATWYGSRVRITYDRLGRLTGHTQAGIAASMSYDSLGRKTVEVDPDAGRWTYGYDAVGNPTSQTDARGVTVSSTYDVLNRIETRTSGAQTLAAYTYDEQAITPVAIITPDKQGVGRLTSMSDPSGSATYDYDVNGRMVATSNVISGQSFTLSRTYDNAGRLKSLTYPDGEVVGYGYDTAGCLKTVGGYVTNASCTANGSLAGRTLGNGLVETMTYSPTRQWLDSTTIKQSDGATLLTLTTSNRNPRGQLLAQTSDSPDLNWTYGYDALGRLTQASNTTNPAWNQTFSYDTLGRVFPGTGGETLTYPATGHPHAPKTHNGTAYTYDANGNRTGGDGRSYTYDPLNRLTNVSGTAYSYDGHNDRVQTGTTRFVGIDGKMLQETTGAAKLKYYYYGGERIARKDQTGAVHYYTNDQLGTANFLTNAGATAISGTAVYGPYGKTDKRTGTPDAFGLAGQRLDPSGLYRMGARYLDPAAATWTSPDPSGAAVNPTLPRTLNRYAYANNDPVNNTDPTGFGSCPPSEPDCNTIVLPEVVVTASRDRGSNWYYNGLPGGLGAAPEGVGIYCPGCDASAAPTPQTAADVPAPAAQSDSPSIPSDYASNEAELDAELYGRIDLVVGGGAVLAGGAILRGALYATRMGVMALAAALRPLPVPFGTAGLVGPARFNPQFINMAWARLLGKPVVSFTDGGVTVAGIVKEAVQGVRAYLVDGHIYNSKWDPKAPVGVEGGPRSRMREIGIVAGESGYPVTDVDTHRASELGGTTVRERPFNFTVDAAGRVRLRR